MNMRKSIKSSMVLFRQREDDEEHHSNQKIISPLQTSAATTRFLRSSFKLDSTSLPLEESCSNTTLSSGGLSRSSCSESFIVGMSKQETRQQQQNQQPRPNQPFILGSKVLGMKRQQSPRSQQCHLFNKQASPSPTKTRRKLGHKLLLEQMSRSLQIGLPLSHQPPPASSGDDSDHSNEDEADEASWIPKRWPQSWLKLNDVSEPLTIGAGCDATLQQQQPKTRTTRDDILLEKLMCCEGQTKITRDKVLLETRQRATTTAPPTMTTSTSVPELTELDKTTSAANASDSFTFSAIFDGTESTMFPTASDHSRSASDGARGQVADWGNKSQFADFVFEGDSDDEVEDERETVHWEGCQNICSER